MSEMATPAFNHLSLVVADMDATLAFYERLGLRIDTAPGGIHSSCDMPGGMRIEWDTAEFAATWDSASRGPSGGGAIIGLWLASRQAVDDLYADLVAAGYHAHQQPYDAFWGSRYAIVDDPDGYSVGLMSPREDDQKYWPPRQPPSS